jgi:MATE family multidrug resistance protein
MLGLALPGLIMVEAEYFAFEILVIASAQLSTTDLAAQTILATLNGAFWQIPFSISIAGTTMIAQHIGAGSTTSAKRSAIVVFIWTLICATTNSTLFFSFRAFWPTIFTNEPDVLKLVKATLPLVALMQLFDGLAACSNGILRGIGRPAFGGWVNLACYYIIALPVSLWTAFGLHWDLKGLWAGVTLALFIVTVAELVFLVGVSWQKSVEDAQWRNSRPLDQEP